MPARGGFCPSAIWRGRYDDPGSAACGFRRGWATLPGVKSARQLIGTCCTRLARAVIVASSLSVVAPAFAANEKEQFFTSRVHPILKEHCFQCHSHEGDKIKGGLVVDSLGGLLTGGDSGAAVVPGDPEKSLLIKAVRYTDEDLQMPPKGRKLSSEQVGVLEQWVRDGAVWPGQTGKPRQARGKISDEDRRWWAFQPLAKVEPPSTGSLSWGRNEVDQFIFAKLKDSGLRPSPEASRATLARRLYFDLWGLPPTSEQVEAFVSDSSPDGYEKLVDRLLASRHYGERWARHWLDLVRYADSDGYRIDDFRPSAWRYRDYVIEAFNSDKPYDEFVREQIAGDEMTPRTPERLVATGYLRHWIYEYNNRDVVGQWATILNDITDTTGDVFLGLGMQCARCHDHKFDPILQKDYYRLQAFFAALWPREDIPVATEREQREHEAKLTKWNEATAEIRAQIEELVAPHRGKAAQTILAKFPEETRALIFKPTAERTPFEHQIAELAYRQVDYEYGRYQNSIKGEDKEKLIALQKQLARFDELKPTPLPRALLVTDVGPNAAPTVTPKRGREPVEPGVLTLLDEKPMLVLAPPGQTNTTGRRTALAQWLTQPENPLTTRVIVNRVWQYHFGRGLVGTSSDFGKLGEKPTHPELLDWLARQFVADGWSFKKLHKLIVTSATYRQQASATRDNGADPLLVDPQNLLVWRFPIRRLDAEQIRDAILAATGELDLTASGPAVDAFKPRRTIYTKVLRNTRDPLLDVFDAPQHFSSTSSRDTTTTPVQSLLLINSQYMLQRATAMATHLQKSFTRDDEMVSAAYRRALGRAPATNELAEALAFWREQEKRVDVERANSASAAFLAEKIPYRDGRGALMSPRSVQERLMVPNNPSLPRGDFSIEAFVVLRSLYEDGQVRTIASHWSGLETQPGWAFGVTSLKSKRKPQTLVLQLSGGSASGPNTYEAVFSDLHIQLNKPYFVAATVSLSDTNEGITFYAKDLSNDDEPMQVAHVAHRVTRLDGSNEPLTLGGRAGHKGHLWDGPIDDVRLSRGKLRQEQLLLTSEAVTDATCGYWQFEPKPSVFRDASPNHNDIRPLLAKPTAMVNARTAALADFCHVLLNANEFLYVE
jgi:mono/diheme cytochrome c family protein